MAVGRIRRVGSAGCPTVVYEVVNPDLPLVMYKRSSLATRNPKMSREYNRRQLEYITI